MPTPTHTSNAPVHLASVLLVLALAAASLALASPASAAPTCFGRTPTIVAKPGVTTRGTSGSDVILGTSGDDVIRGRGGRDYICSGAGDDKVYGGRGRDYIDLGAGDDFARGGPGGDYIEGGSGSDLIRGRGGRDTINAEAGIDRCYGGAGRDTLYSCNEQPIAPVGTPAPGGLSASEQQMIDLVNDLRSANGVPRLSVSLEVSAVARDWSAEMSNGFRHNPNVATQIPAGATWWGENIAFNSSVEANFNALVNSPGHFENMVDPRFTHLGVGVATVGGRVYVTQVLVAY